MKLILTFSFIKKILSFEEIKDADEVIYVKNIFEKKKYQEKRINMTSLKKTFI